MGVLNKFVDFIKGDRTVKSIKEKDHYLTITENFSDRSLKFNGITYSRLNNNSIYTGSYWDYFTPLPSLYENPSILMIGLGGGTIYHQLKKIYGKDVDIRVVEASEKVINLAEDFLGYNFNKSDIIVDDGSKVVKREKDRYDVVILDAYNETYIPKAFLTDGFIEDSFEALKDSGILAINFALSAKNMIYYNRYLNMLGKHFKVYRISNGNLLGNVIILCTKKMDKNEINKRIHERYENVSENKHVIDGYLSMRN